ncbi:MAG TPA: WD40 repeat domain-containing protein [Pirellulales bacterium]
MLRLLHEFQLEFRPYRLAVASESGRVVVGSADSPGTWALLNFDRERGFTSNATHSRLAGLRPFAASNGTILFARREGGELVVAELGPSDEIREARYEAVGENGERRFVGGFSEDRVAFKTSKGTELFRFPGTQCVGQIDQQIDDVWTHPSGKLVAFTLWDNDWQQLGFYANDGVTRQWLTPLLETFDMIDAVAFSGDGRVMGLISRWGKEVCTSLYSFPKFRLLHHSTRNWDDRLGDSKHVSIEGGIAFHPRRERYFTCEPGGAIVERDYVSGREVSVTDAHNGRVWQVESLPRLDALVSIGSDNLIKLWSHSDAPATDPPPLVCDAEIMPACLQYMGAVDESVLKRFETWHTIAPMTSFRAADEKVFDGE